MEETKQGRAQETEDLIKTIIAERRAIKRRLGPEDSPSRWQGGHHGWFLGKKYIERTSLKTQRMRLIELPSWPIKISALRPEGQLIAYQSLLRTARLDQVAAYYRLHCEQLDNVRCSVAHQLTMHRESDKQFRQAFPFLASRQDDVAKSSKMKKAAHAVNIADKQYRLRAGNRAYARGLELLIENCEVRLQNSEHFTPADWRPYDGRPRWADGKRGWTGLRPEEVDVCTVDNAKGEAIDSRKTRCEKSQAVLRTRYARSFPRAADRRLANHASEDKGGGKIVAAGGTGTVKAVF